MASVSELSQLFPALDDDLTAVGTQFTFDQHRALLQQSCRVGDPQTRTSEDEDGLVCSSGGEEDSEMPDVTDGDADMSLDLLACSAYETEVITPHKKNITNINY